MRSKLLSFMIFSVLLLTGLISSGALIDREGPAPSASRKIAGIVFTEELSIGVPEGDKNYMFGSSVAFNVDDKGNIYVLDWEEKQYKKFGPDGKHIVTFGKAGQGPGEFRNPAVVRFTEDGRLYISENWGDKIMYYDANGVYQDQRKLPEKIYDVQATPAGTYMGRKQIAPQFVGQGPVQDLIVLFDKDFKQILELYRESFTFPDRSLSQAESQAEITSTFLNRPTALFEIGPNGRIYFGRNDLYAVDVYAPEGKKLLTITRDVPPLPYEKKDKDFMLKLYEENMRKGPYAPAESVIKEYLGLIRFPKNKPFFRGFIPMEDGRLAVVVDSNDFAAAWFDLFSPEGGFLGRIKISVPWSNMLFKNGKAYSLSRDEEGFYSIKRFRYEIQYEK